ncbi:MAG: EAL domain-containing protein [Alphaproteobacteria bacterium]|nr:EAL domain-containing protein [Alphaproteobacteria bacterium]
MLKAITKDAEARLVEMVESLKEQPTGWRTLHFRFSRLLEHYKSDYQVKIAVNLITDLLREPDGAIFVCSDYDIIILAKGAQKSNLEKVVFQLRYLFMDDPLAYNADGQENPDFSTIYDLSIEFDDFSVSTRRKLGASAKSEVLENLISGGAGAQSKTGGASSSAQATAARRIKPITPVRLATIERDLLPADLSRVIRKQSVCAAPENKPIRRVFDELYINIAHLRQILMADVDFTSNRWLFKYLTQLLDEKVLTLLRHNPNRYFDMPVSINLNVATLLSEKFAEFDAAIKPSVKVSVVLELQVADVFSDMEAFIVARDTVQKMGYRVCLDGLTTLSFLQVDRERLGFDLAKLQWNADAETDLLSDENRAISDAVTRCGANRIILCRCDTKEAVDYGKAMGISLFQGRYLDRTLNPNAKVEN